MYSTLSISQLGPATSLGRIREGAPNHTLVPCCSFQRPAGGRRRPRPAPLPGYITEPTGLASGRPGPGCVFQDACVLPVPNTQVLRGSDYHHRGCGGTRSLLCRSGREIRARLPCVPQPQRPSARAATSARSRQRGRRPLVCRGTLPALSPRLLAGVAAPAG